MARNQDKFLVDQTLTDCAQFFIFDIPFPVIGIPRGGRCGVGRRRREPGPVAAPGKLSLRESFSTTPGFGKRDHHDDASDFVTRDGHGRPGRGLAIVRLASIHLSIALE